MAQAPLFNTICYPFTGALLKLAMATASAQQEEERRDTNYTQESEEKSTVKLRIAKQTTTKYNSIRRRLLVSEHRIIFYFKQEKLLARREQAMLARGIMEFLPIRPFYTSPDSSTNEKLHLREHVVIGHSNNVLSTIADPEVACHTLVGR